MDPLDTNYHLKKQEEPQTVQIVQGRIIEILGRPKSNNNKYIGEG